MAEPTPKKEKINRRKFLNWQIMPADSQDIDAREAPSKSKKLSAKMFALFTRKETQGKTLMLKPEESATVAKL